MASTLFGAEAAAETPFVADGSGDCLSGLQEKARWAASSRRLCGCWSASPTTSGRAATGCPSTPEKISRKRRDRFDPGMARHQASGAC